MKRIFFLLFFLIVASLSIVPKTYALETSFNEDDYTLTCGCPSELAGSYNQSEGEQCVSSYEAFKQNPAVLHYWYEDPDITAQGKADERARQFIYWTLNTNSIDNHPTLLSIWNTTRNISYFFTLIVAAILGLGIIIGQRANFSNKIQVWPQIWKILLMLLYITFSATVVILIIQLSEILMKFFIENLGGKDLFNIDFGEVSNENSYTQFIRGCRDLNIRVQEGAQAEVFLLKLTNITYYVMGAMIILRKILLWFLLVVSPFLAILMPFVFIRNVGWIWIGVFFQWVFYGPLFALFLGALATIWKKGIPFIFDFSRVETTGGYIYPTAINILYGGPAQRLKLMNNGNYVDTFAEYIVTLIMLWAVIFFPWWLLRIFRDYCCDGIYAMKNILLSMYDQMHGGPNPQGPTPSIIPSSLGNIMTSLKMQKDINVPVQIKLETVEEIKRTKTESITQSLKLSASRITDVAHFETNKTTRETVNKNLNYLKNPISAQTPTERQKYVNIRTELFNRALKDDQAAKRVLSSISTSTTEQMKRREELLKTVSPQVPVTHIISVKVNMPSEKVKSVATSVIKNISANQNIVASISEVNNLSTVQTQSILTSLAQHIDQPADQITKLISGETNIPKERVATVIETYRQINKMQSTTPSSIQSAISNTSVTTSISNNTKVSIKDVQKTLQSFSKHVNKPADQITDAVAQETNVSKENVTAVIQSFKQIVKNNEEINSAVSQTEQVDYKQLKNVMDNALPVIAAPTSHIEDTVSIPPTVSIEDYEQVKKMWQEQYEKGEVPVSDTITTREAWVDKDIIFISNTLNKIMSSDQKLREQGLDDIGYILPIFLINSMKGEELVVYLKAKLEAAKMVKNQSDKEKEILEKVQNKNTEEFVDVEKPKAKEAEKTIEMSNALEQELPADKPKPEPVTPPKEENDSSAK